MWSDEANVKTSQIIYRTPGTAVDVYTLQHLHGHFTNSVEKALRMLIPSMDFSAFANFATPFRFMSLMSFMFLFHPVSTLSVSTIEWTWVNACHDSSISGIQWTPARVSPGVHFEFGPSFLAQSLFFDPNKWLQMTSRSRNRFKLWLKHLCTAICFSPCIWPLANLAINDSTWALSRMSLCPSPVDKLCIQIALRKCGHKMTQFWEKTKWRWSIKPIYEDDKKSLKRCKAVQWEEDGCFFNYRQTSQTC